MIVLDYPPALNSHWRVWKGRILVSAKSRAYKLAAQIRAASMGVRPLQGELSVTLHFYRPQKSGDLDGRLKVLFDCMNGVLWVDDAQVVEIHAFRHEDKKRPRVEVETMVLGATSDAPRKRA